KAGTSTSFGVTRISMSWLNRDLGIQTLSNLGSHPLIFLQSHVVPEYGAAPATPVHRNDKLDSNREHTTTDVKRARLQPICAPDAGRLRVTLCRGCATNCRILAISWQPSFTRVQRKAGGGNTAGSHIFRETHY